MIFTSCEFTYILRVVEFRKRWVENIDKKTCSLQVTGTNWYLFGWNFFYNFPKRNTQKSEQKLLQQSRVCMCNANMNFELVMNIWNDINKRPEYDFAGG